MNTQRQCDILNSLRSAPDLTQAFQERTADGKTVIKALPLTIGHVNVATERLIGIVADSKEIDGTASVLAVVTCPQRTFDSAKRPAIGSEHT